MPTLQIMNQTGESVEKLKLAKDVFGVEANPQVIYDVIRSQRGAMRQGTHMTKNRSAVRGGGRKPYRQKGTGRARQGTIRAPQYVGGGVVFGPTPRNYEYKINKKVRRLAMRSVLTDKVKENALIAIDKVDLENYKTKEMVALFDSVKAEGKILFVVEAFAEGVVRATRNIANVTLVRRNHLSVYDIMNADCIVATKEALTNIEEALS